MSVRKILIAGIAFAAFTGVLAACGGSSAPAATATPATVATEAATVAEAETVTESTAVTGSAETETTEIARPSNGNLTPGPAITENIVGDPKAGAQVYVDNCKKCHGEEGAVGIDNPGSTDGTVPNLNPIDETLVSTDPKVFAANIDLFIEHGSTPEGDNPKQVMDAWGDTGKLTKQQIADVIAYIISLNQPSK